MQHIFLQANRRAFNFLSNGWPERLSFTLLADPMAEYQSVALTTLYIHPIQQSDMPARLSFPGPCLIMESPLPSKHQVNFLADDERGGKQ